MRLLLALLAVLGLLASPVSAAAAQAACSQMTSASMSGADASGMKGMQHSAVQKAGEPGCDHHGKGAPAKSCAQLCAAACAVADILAEPVVSVPFVMTAAEHALAPAASIHPFEPIRAERPPKSIA